MSDEQRTANTVGPEPQPAALTGEALRIEHARLSALIEDEDAVAKAAELEASPPRPADEIMYDFMAYVTAHCGYPKHLDDLLAELKRSYGK